tara:strand:- start:9026 stop:9211 length:186 start_codon:yes stop_codon:yes gene_type:complete
MKSISIKMNSFEPTVLGVFVLLISMAELNDLAQLVLVLVTIIYTLIKIYELIKKQKNEKDN